MSAKRSVWAVIGKVLWTIVSFFFRILLKIIAALGSRWARKKLQERDPGARKKGRLGLGRRRS